MTQAVTYQQTIPVTSAREVLGQLVGKVKKGKERFYLLTKRGRPEAVLVDVKFWEEVMSRLRSAYQTTYLEPGLAKYTREFSDQEVEEWAKADRV